MNCKDCKFATKNKKRIDGLDRELVCKKLGDILALWFAPQVPDYFGCNGFEPKVRLTTRSSGLPTAAIDNPSLPAEELNSQVAGAGPAAV